MPKKTYTQINSVTLAAASSSITFGSIPQNFRDLVLVSNFTKNATAQSEIRFNNDSGSNYSTVAMRGGANSDVLSAAYTTSFIQPSNGTGEPSGANIFWTLQIMDYSATDKHKSTLLRMNSPATFSTGHIQAQANRWANTAAITAINIISTTFDAGSTFTLYGIEA